ncbi:MAG: hypothetical protein ACFFAE_17825 [Candidatus Hodarchaeota archaeon]
MASPIRSITIINEAGLPIASVSRLSQKDEVQKDLVKAGFTSALQSYSIEVTGKKSIESIDFADYRMVYLESINCIICAEVDKELTHSVVQRILQNIDQLVRDKFSSIIQKQIVERADFKSLNDFMEKFVHDASFEAIMRDYGYDVSTHPRGVLLIQYGGDTPEIIHSYGVDPLITSEIVGKIPKSFIESIKTEIETQTESIVPFPQSNKIGFVFFSSLPVNGNNIPIALATLFSDEEQVLLYRQAPVLSKRSRDVINRMKAEIPTLGLNHLLTPNIQEQINELSSIAKFEVVVKERVFEREIAFRDPEIIRPNVRFLNNASKKGIDGLIAAVIIGKPIAVIGDPPLVELVFTTLEMFCPHRSPKKLPYTTKFIDADFVGIEPKLRKEYLKQDYVILDLPKKKVHGGKPSTFAQRLLDSTKDLEGDVCSRLIQTRLNWLVSKATQLAEVCRGEVNRQEIETLKTDVEEKETFELIAHIAETFNPATKEIIRKVSSAAMSVSSYLDDF